jgi:hypothetical protein
VPLGTSYIQKTIRLLTLEDSIFDRACAALGGLERVEPGGLERLFARPTLPMGIQHLRHLHTTENPRSFQAATPPSSATARMYPISRSVVTASVEIFPSSQ